MILKNQMQIQSIQSDEGKASSVSNPGIANAAVLIYSYIA